MNMLIMVKVNVLMSDALTAQLKSAEEVRGRLVEPRQGTMFVLRLQGGAFRGEF